MATINKNAILVIDNPEDKNRKIDVTIDGNTINMKSTKNKLVWTNNDNAKFYVSNNIITNAKSGMIIDPSSSIVYDSKNSKNGKAKSLNSYILYMVRLLVFSSLFSCHESIKISR